MLDSDVTAKKTEQRKGTENCKGGRSSLGLEASGSQIVFRVGGRGSPRR